ncbi:YkvA family protein [Halomonas sp. I5-271120]|uniref:YkvA family protein n=1 Tax=Halomonas sp. I5-271120 TaxID=3061632 RepID=UPI0027F6DCA0
MSDNQPNDSNMPGAHSDPAADATILKDEDDTLGQAESSSTSEGDASEQNEPLGSDSTDEAHRHKDEYSDAGFWNKTTTYAKKAGEKALSPALRMYYAAQDPDTPTWAKSTIYGGLGYFISPVDALPDITPIVGYTDDIGVLAGAIGIVAAHIKDEHVAQAQATLKRWFS